MHADMSCDTKQLRVRSFALQALEALVRSLCIFVLDEHLAVALRHVLVVIVYSKHIFTVFGFFVIQNPGRLFVIGSEVPSVVLEHLLFAGLKSTTLAYSVSLLLVRLDHGAVFDISSSQEGEETTSF